MANLTNRLLWWCLVVSQLIYVVVAHVADPPGNPEAVNVLLPVLIVISIAMGVGSLVYRRYALSPMHPSIDSRRRSPLYC